MSLNTPYPSYFTMLNASDIPNGEQSGYNTPLYGLHNGKFLTIHIPALICIFLSLLSAMVVIVSSFSHQKMATFFTWSKSERFAVYIAICDGLFNVCHSMDHLHIVISKDHVHPKALCIFYGFMLAETITAQNLLVNVVSINAFVIVYFRKNIHFGSYDWKLLSWMFGVPCLAGLIAVCSDTIGPNGVFCYFDSIKGELANLFFTTIPLLIVLFVNSTLYIFTWLRLRAEEPRFKNAAGHDARIIRASHRAAKCMSLFVTAFFIQWWAMAIYGVWQVVDHNVPLIMFQFVTTFSNIGGVLNGIVYFIIRRKKLVRGHGSSAKESTEDILEIRPSFHVRKQSNMESFRHIDSPGDSTKISKF